MHGYFFYAMQCLSIEIVFKAGGCAHMPFWLHESKLMLALKSMPIRTKVITSLIIMTTSTASWILFSVIPQKNIVSRQKNEYEQLCKQHTAFASVIARSDDINQRYKKLEASFDVLQQSCGSVQTTMGILLQLMQQHGISCRGIQQKENKAKDFYEKQYVVITGRGNFKQVLNFFHDVEAANCPIKFKKVSMNKGKQLLKFQALVRVITLQGGGG